MTRVVVMGNVAAELYFSYQQWTVSNFRMKTVLGVDEYGLVQDF